MKEFGLAPGRLRGKGMEVQSADVSTIARLSAAETFRRYRRPLFAEDTGLFMTSLRGFPGPYASFVYATIGLEGLLELASKTRDRSAEFVSAVAYVSSGIGPKVFVGRLRGRLASRPSGSHGFGFDPVFIPVGYSKTLAELSLREKCEISHRASALRALGEWLTSERGRQSLSAQR
ncbi:MAG: hypothetical protein LYZ69_04425 [Nitrososphaerales archaeon]|nr:hypothetical protein [Nitrososphaerales archaeon]